MASPKSCRHRGQRVAWSRTRQYMHRVCLQGRWHMTRLVGGSRHTGHSSSMRRLSPASFFWWDKQVDADMAATDTRYFVYWIQSQGRAYIGATVDPTKRLRQHNGEIVGGAARTRNRGPWHFHCVISGFRTWKEALQFEWAAKYHSRRARGIAARREAIEALCARERWTSNSPLSAEVPLQFEYTPTQYGSPPEVYAPLKGKASTAPRRKSAPRKRFKKTLHRVNY